MKNLVKIKREKRKARHRRVRAKIKGTKQRPRLCVFRSNRHIYAQLIDDGEGKTLVSASDFEVTTKKNKKAVKSDLAKAVGKLIAQKAAAKKIKEVVFDRGGYKYHGRVKALAEAAREAGLKF